MLHPRVPKRVRSWDVTSHRRRCRICEWICGHRIKCSNTSILLSIFQVAAYISSPPPPHPHPHPLPSPSFQKCTSTTSPSQSSSQHPQPTPSCVPPCNPSTPWQAAAEPSPSPPTAKDTVEAVRTPSLPFDPMEQVPKQSDLECRHRSLLERTGEIHV
ncbi:hypothetical protein BJ875DRAFT_286167 [Amylocarpus encephaloides]|uniref:Uncharacterized protein n=1 Tax=Amylocarpus encephaloides TaxID=45428 RepID=A0A9P8C9J4_9HELO|nr:hypothetical protein BJ875DRAFT_286167 [Amylocarpus encephaloides]